MDIKVTETKNADSFLRALAAETKWEWKWEKLNRRWLWGINVAMWISRLLILALAWFQWTRASESSELPWGFFSLAVLSTLNIALPLLIYPFRFQQRQEVHDRNAREYECIKVEFDSGQIDLATAIKRFTETRRQATEKTVRNVP